MGTVSGEPSTLLLDEAFAREDDRFVELLRQIQSVKHLAGLADRWKRDPRPWSREQILIYLSHPLDRPGHHPVVKRLFKHAEAQRDSELMTHFVVAFDRLIRRQRRMRFRFGMQRGEYWQEERLYSPRDQILAPNPHGPKNNSVAGARTPAPVPRRIPKNGRLFTYATRSYLRRRAWRYFRWLGFSHPAEYPASVARILRLYTDSDFARGENILDNWSLLQIAFRHSPVLRFRPASVQLQDGQSLRNLQAAPRFENLWAQPNSMAVLLRIVIDGQSRLVRNWAIQLLKRLHGEALSRIGVDKLVALLDHADAEVQQFGAGLLGSVREVDSWPVATWLRLLETRNVESLTAICDAMRQRVRPDRLDVQQCVTLACARMTPIARMGFQWLRQRPLNHATDRAALARLANAACEALGFEIAEYALSEIGTHSNYQTDHVIRFFDSLNSEVRRGAWHWLTPDSPGYADADLWSRLSETPYDDVRLRLLEALRDRARRGPSSNGRASRRDVHSDSLTKTAEASTARRAPNLRREELVQLWSSILLNVHRGGRAKIHALRMIAQTMAAYPAHSQELLPILVVAIRSVRPAEARVGLSALLSATTLRPELEAELGRALPELRLIPAEARA